MKIIIKNFPLTLYTIIFFIFFVLFTLSNPDMSSDNFIAFFWNTVLIIFFPMAIAVKNGNIMMTIIFVIIFDLLSIYIRKCLIPAIKKQNKNLLIPKILKEKRKKWKK